jgi:hypothetical protein
VAIYERIKRRLAGAAADGDDGSEFDGQYGTIGNYNTPRSFAKTPFDIGFEIVDAAAYIATLEKLLANYPKKDYWNAYLGRLPRKAGFADRFALDLMRLRLASGTLGKAEDFMEMAQLSLQAGLPAEARRIAEQGFKAGLLGTGPEAGRHQRLRDLAVKQEGESKTNLAAQAAEAESFKEGDGLVKVGYAYVSIGQVDQGIELIQKGIAKGSLKRPEDAKLRLGMAQLQSPKSKTAGMQTLRSIKGTDGVAEIARLWTILGAS